MPRFRRPLMIGISRIGTSVLSQTASQALALRVRIVLACAENGGVTRVAAVAGRADRGVPGARRKWRVRFAESRLTRLDFREISLKIPPVIK
jgi:hypothetical protein